MRPGTVLVVGASGLVGAAATRAFAQAGHHVIALSRRAPEDVGDVQHENVDLRDADAVQGMAARHQGITHVVYAAVHEMPGLVAGWKSPEQMSTNLNMMRNLFSALDEHAVLEHVTALQGTKAYGVHHHPIRVPARESEPRDPHDNFYWLQEDFLREHAEARGHAWTILRPPLVVGPTHGVAMNVLPVIGLYAALCRDEGRPFSYPGGPSYVAEALDCRLLADALVWAATTPAAWGEHFNITNGEVFEWRDLWPTLADALGLDVGPGHPMSVRAWIESRSERWDALVEREGLRQLTTHQVVGESDHYADFQFAHRASSPPPPALMSTIKIRQAGFHGVMSTAESMVHWLDALAVRRVIPRAA